MNDIMAFSCTIIPTDVYEFSLYLACFKALHFYISQRYYTYQVGLSVAVAGIELLKKTTCETCHMLGKCLYLSAHLQTQIGPFEIQSPDNPTICRLNLQHFLKVQEFIHSTY